MSDTTGLVLAADGRPLRHSLNRALRRQKLRALLLIAPLLIFVMLSFVAPIADMLFRSVQNNIVSDTIPRTVVALKSWDAAKETVPDEAVYSALYTDLVIAERYKLHSQLGTRLNYEFGGASSLFRSTGRSVGRFAKGEYAKQFAALDPAFADPAAWASWMDNKAIRKAFPQTASAYTAFAKLTNELRSKKPEETLPQDFVFTALAQDVAAGATVPGMPEVAAASLQPVSYKDLFIADDARWGEPGIWQTIRIFSGKFTAGYFLNAVDLRMTPDGIESLPDTESIYGLLFKRTLIMSMAITLSCILLGYPIAWLCANLPNRSANVLMILVLLPFWTSLLVRTSAWKVLLQREGVINDLLVWTHILSENNRLELINNQTGTIIAMTHILLPFMILPMYSVMKTIPPYYLRAAKSMGANNWTAFWRVYFPQSVPGIGAGSILVFILAIGYYITPALVGGTTGTFISNRIAYHISSTLNWGLAAALGTILLAAVMLLYWAYDRIVGIDNVKLGG